CTAFDISSLTQGCRNGFPTPAIGQQFAVRAGGVVSQRVHVNVDYDTEREFSASNNINVFYQGLEDEILRRVDIGNVTFDAPRSRFITAAIPANSFGIQTLSQVGPLEIRTILAQQRGSSLRTRVFTIGDQSTQPVDRETCPGFPRLTCSPCRPISSRRATGSRRSGFIGCAPSRGSPAPTRTSAGS